MDDGIPTRKVIVLGSPGVGKTSLVRRLVHRVYEADYLTTMGVDIYPHVVDLAPPANKTTPRLRLTIWDSQGDLGHRIFKHPYFAGSVAVVVCAEITKRRTIDEMVALAHAAEVAAAGRPLACVLTKLDLLEAKSGAAAEPDLPAVLTEGRWPLYRTSALADLNVAGTFAAIAGTIVRRGL